MEKIVRLETSQRAGSDFCRGIGSFKPVFLATLWSILGTTFTKQVQRASADKSVPRRVRCLLQDVLDLRKEGWKSQRPGCYTNGQKDEITHGGNLENAMARRKDLSKETPQTLAEVHEKAMVLLRKLIIEEKVSTSHFRLCFHVSSNWVFQKSTFAITRCLHPVLDQSRSCF